jgi:hypothetical protein
MVQCNSFFRKARVGGGGLVVVICCVWYARKDATPGLFWWCVSGKTEELRGAVEVFVQSGAAFF